MIVYFPEPDENELYYSLIARFHSYSTDTAASNTLKEFSGTKHRINLDVPMGIDILIPKIEKFSNRYSISYNNPLHKTLSQGTMLTRQLKEWHTYESR